ncbi:Pre-mRNA cleavage complex II protein Clp1-domain-containing protein [Lentinula aciculospora]|uniref:Polynucleotide 5'-hydroxyl-kinase GRC3 n=1 Tax=Lentinula aciculospora TaxID=153920 RepID=A0A9W9DWN8_9AGAR|nr:Pre-mRNA cleavage complex II protein Clp1-domain-containing protein [Lentinula aciculospora]
MHEEHSFKEWVLHAETEYRFELDAATSLAITLTRGRAEIFGAELVEGKPYLFGSECKAAVFTWVGCTIEMSFQFYFKLPSRCQPSTEYVSDETPMSAYGNLHIAFEQMRVKALAKLHGSPVPESAHSTQSKPQADFSAEPPRVLILGPENSGKTSISKVLVNYAVRAGQGWSPILANVDPIEGGWACPGALSAAAVHGPISTCSPANPLGSAATSAPTTLSSNAILPLVYWYGHAETKRNPSLMERLIRNLGVNVQDKFDQDPEGSTAGIIIDTPSSFAASLGPGVNDHRQKLIRACIDAFRINTILIVGHEKLNVEMQRSYGSTLTVLKIPKSGGVVELDHSYRERVHKYQMHTYMYGEVIPSPSGIRGGTQGGETLTDLILAPSSNVINFSDLTIYRIGAETMAPSSALPIGAARVVSEMQPVLVDPAQPGSGLLNAVLAVLAPYHPDENERYDEELLDLTVIGFIVITNLDIPHKKMTVLSPTQGSLVGKTAIVGSYEWQD